MKKNRMVIRFMTFSITYLSFMSLSAQRSLDSLDHVMDQNYKPFILGFSEKGKSLRYRRDMAEAMILSPSLIPKGKAGQWETLLIIKSDRCF